MEFLLIILLSGTLAWLWNRVDRLEYRLKMFEAQELQDAPAAPVKSSTKASPDAPPPPIASVPLARKEDTAPSTFSGELPERINPRAEAPAPVEEGPPESLAEDIPPRPRFEFDFEDIFGRKLPIWAGGITLAIAGVFLVRYSIESGLLTPIVRVALAFMFGGLLLGGAEWAYRNAEKVADERARQSLAGAGLATLYAAFYLAGSQYGLLGQTVAFLGLAAVTAGAIALSFRFGLPCAILGLVGGFAAPALVGGDEANLPLLSLYLGLVTAGLTVTGKRQARPWLSIAALVFGLGWGALLLLAGDPGVAEILALGLYFIVLGAVLPALAGVENFERPMRLASAFVASIQLALLVDQGGYGALAWGLYLLLGGTLAFLAWRKPKLRETGAVAAVVAVLLLAQWDSPNPVMFALVTAGLAVVYAVVPLAHIWRKSACQVDLYQLAGAPFVLAVVAYATFGKPAADILEPELAFAAFALASLPLSGAWRIWRAETVGQLALLITTGALLLFGALLLVTPAWLAVAIAVLSFAWLFFLLQEREEIALRGIVWGFSGITLVALLSAAVISGELPRLSGISTDTDRLRAGIRWLAALAPWAILAWSEQERSKRSIAEVLAAVAGYGLLAQFLPDSALTWAAAIGAIALYQLQRHRVAGQLALLAVAGLWALMPLAAWAVAGIAAIAGDPMFHRDLPSLRELLIRVLPLAVAMGLVRLPLPARFPAKAFDSRLLALPVGIVIAHTLFKQAFAIDTVTAFTSFGMAERTLWQALLLGGAVMLQRGLPGISPQPRFAAPLAIASLAHALWFSGLLHNPLWDRQAVGPTPLANLALVAGAVAIGAALLLRRHAVPIRRPLFDGVIMAIASITALALLRQFFAGPVLVDLQMSQTEDLLRSLLGIVLALAFLFIGKHRGERSWRIGSLVLMLLAVAKVFLVDAAGLEGLLRIASFMALGFSLIGIGWIYARQLRQPLQTAQQVDN